MFDSQVSVPKSVSQPPSPTVSPPPLKRRSSIPVAEDIRQTQSLEYPSFTRTYLFEDVEYNSIVKKFVNVMSKRQEIIQSNNSAAFIKWSGHLQAFLLTEKFILENLSRIVLAFVNERTIEFLIQMEHHHDIESVHQLKSTIETLLPKLKKLQIHLDDDTLISSHEEKFYIELLENTDESFLKKSEKISSIFEDGNQQLTAIYSNGKIHGQNLMADIVGPFESKYAEFSIGQCVYNNFDLFCEDILKKGEKEISQTFEGINIELTDLSRMVDDPKVSKDIVDVAGKLMVPIKTATKIARDTFNKIKKEMGVQSAKGKK